MPLASANRNATPPDRHIVLAGGGYAHLLLMRRWARQPLPGTRLTLISPQTELPYSAMLPGLLAGEYSPQESHIDLRRLCRGAGVQLVLDEVRGLDREQQRVLLSQHGTLDYDLLSINTGPVSDRSVPGVAEHAVPLKPLACFLPHWQQCLRQLQLATRPLQLVMVGAGAGGLESLLGMARGIARDQSIVHKPQLTLLGASDRLLPDFPATVGRVALARCRAAGIEVLCGQRVSRVEAGLLYTDNRLQVPRPYDILFWCGDTAAAAWPAASGLTCDGKGFIGINAQLQSIGDKRVFAAGDAAAFSERALPKAGVFAVRQAPVLFHNLRAALSEQPLRAYRPQQRFLSLLDLGDKLATGSYGQLAAQHRLLRRWKSAIDRHFMRGLQALYQEP